MAKFFRVVEQEDGSWLCRYGREAFDFYAQLDDAVEHTTGIANEDRPSKVFVHRCDGQVRTIATLDLSRSMPCQPCWPVWAQAAQVTIVTSLVARA